MRFDKQGLDQKYTAPKSIKLIKVNDLDFTGYYFAKIYVSTTRNIFQETLAPAGYIPYIFVSQTGEEISSGTLTRVSAEQWILHDIVIPSRTLIPENIQIVENLAQYYLNNNFRYSDTENDAAALASQIGLPAWMVSRYGYSVFKDVPQIELKPADIINITDQLNQLQTIQPDTLQIADEITVKLLSGVSAADQLNFDSDSAEYNVASNNMYCDSESEIPTLELPIPDWMVSRFGYSVFGHPPDLSYYDLLTLASQPNVWDLGYNSYFCNDENNIPSLGLMIPNWMVSKFNMMVFAIPGKAMETTTMLETIHLLSNAIYYSAKKASIDVLDSVESAAPYYLNENYHLISSESDIPSLGLSIPDWMVSRYGYMVLGSENQNGGS